MSLFKKFVSSTARDQYLFFAALVLSLIVKIVVFSFPLRWYARFLFIPANNSSEITQSSYETIQEISKAVNRCSRFAPWQTKCLVDAITAKLLLKWHGIPSTIFLGVNKDNERKLTAHAWLKCGDIFITGKRGYQKFTVVSSFA